MSGIWDENISAQAFSTLNGQATRVRVTEGGYELTTIAPIAHRPQLVSATLVLDRHLRPVGEIVRVHAGSGVRELRFVLAEYERRPSLSIPDSVFNPAYDLHSTPNSNISTQQNRLPKTPGADLQLAQLQIAVLYELNNLGSDTGEPIEAVRMPDGYIRVSGTVADSSLKRDIVSHLEALKDHQLLDLQLRSPSEIRIQAPKARQRSDDTHVYNLGQGKSEADAMLRRYFESKQISGVHLDSAIGQYSRDALQHAQRALQHTYALNRLSNALSVNEFRSISISSRQQWSDMVSGHATDLAIELRALHNQLAQIESPGKQVYEVSVPFIPIEDPEQFDQATSQLLLQTQKLNTEIGSLFTSNPSSSEEPEALLATTMKAIPLHQAEEITRFAARLKAAGGSESSGTSVDQHNVGTPK
jgi:hypothetical protein